MPRIAWLRSHSASVVSSIAALDATPGVGDDDVDAAEALHRGRERAATSSSEVTSPPTPTAAVAECRDGRRGALAVEVEPDDAGAGAGQRVDDRAADAARGTGDQRDLPCSSPGGGAERQLVELERPVLDGEALAASSDTKPPTACAPAITSIARW